MFPESRRSATRCAVFTTAPAEIPAPVAPEKGKRRGLPMVPSGPMRPRVPRSLSEVAHRADTLWVRAPDLARAREALAAYPDVQRLELELDDYGGVDGDVVEGRTLTRAMVRDAAQAERLLALPATFEVVVDLVKANEAFLLAASSSLRSAVSRPSGT